MLKAISLFSGVGGLDFGFEAAGFKTSVAVEMDKYCCQNMRENQGWVVLEEAIENVSTEDLLKAADLKVGEADVLIGGPPCQPFSKMGYWSTGDSKRLSDPRANTLIEYLRVLEEAQPKAFLLENVQGMTFSNKDDGFKFLLDGIEEINQRAGTNYSSNFKVLNAAEYGVPQHRSRFFLIGCREGTEFSFPEITHKDQSKGENELLFEGKNLKPFNTAWDAIGDLPDPKDPTLNLGGKWADLLPSIPEGENYLWHTDRKGGLPIFGWRTRYWNFLLKLSKKLPSWTIAAQPGSATGPFHWNNRRLSPEEMGRLQTFPDGLTYSCHLREVQRMIGNAVPSLMAEILASEIKYQFFGMSKRRKYKLMPKKNEKRAISTAVQPVDQKYQDLVGCHKAHPGTGKGPGAIRQSS
ncbi:DNA cytosine methyltransferase [Pseudobacteriovorax antillogorgiicola]|uniref:Cytosine-specific methyltransferase n=1 Tax=Pseudobacteriovorax antillogorgiicola TaxID=1513793 RepID=A0A1Y6CP49_9BACT|nr:DNA cytosine methyltransferase [Pseudobacteriovorax antillogorgiicola]TCS44204.1 DNA (cytosine-5)-methyltransferase 1 [Pseudobacteriovorax antillogorgiicola]SMF80381.1 DNA (cytosine-5)-methyltransferase 1 [Pseudobacteriovorax antillogorgiicola]